MGTLVFLHNWPQARSQMTQWNDGSMKGRKWPAQCCSPMIWNVTEGCRYCMLLREPVYETILFRRPCLDTHQPPTHNHTSLPTHTHTILQFQSVVRLSVREKGLRNLTSWSVFLLSFRSQNQTSQLSPLRQLFYSYISLCLFCPLLRVFSLSFITVGKHLLWVWHLPANTNTPSTEEPTGHSQQCADLQPSIQQKRTATLLPAANIRPHTHSHMQKRDLWMSNCSYLGTGIPVSQSPCRQKTHVWDLGNSQQVHYHSETCDRTD